MFKYLQILFFVIAISCNNKKDNLNQIEPCSNISPKLQFVFLNKLGFRQDSCGNGSIDTVFRGLCVRLKHYKKSKDITYLGTACYNRDYIDIENRLKDSIILYSDELTLNDKYALEVELVWKRNIPNHTTKVLRYTTTNWPIGDTVKIISNTILSFTWPTDTNSGRFIKTYQFP